MWFEGLFEVASVLLIFFPVYEIYLQQGKRSAVLILAFTTPVLVTEDNLPLVS